jgi:hypothetical protein
MACADCPVPAGTKCHSKRHTWFCRYAASGDPERIAHVVSRNAAEGGTSFPPLATQAANLAGTVARFVASGGELATPEERARRLAICEGCEFFKGRRCVKCGCRLRAKVAMASEHCPLDPPKW